MVHPISDSIELPPSYPSLERERELLHELREDDRDRVARAFTQLVQPLLPMLTAIAGTRLRDAREAEDAVQDTLLHYWKHCHRLTIQKRLAAYLFATVHNTVTDRLRRRRVEERYAEKVVRERRQTEAAEWVLPVDDTLFMEDAGRHIERALSQLAPVCRDIWRMRQLQRFSYDDVAEAFHVSVKTVKLQVWKGNVHIKGALTEVGVLDRYPVSTRGRWARREPAALPTGARKLAPPRPADPLLADLSIQRPVAEEQMLSQEPDSDA